MEKEASLFSVQGRKVIISGGSRGIGLMLARSFCAAGAEVLISARKEQALEEVVTELGPRCSAVAADLGTEAGVEKLVKAVERRWEGVDVLINNAGATWGAPVEEYPLPAFDKLWRLNVKGPFALVQGLLPAIRRDARDEAPSRIINIGSIDGLRVPMFENYAYSASKAALHQLTRHLAADLAKDPILVNAIAPGPFASQMMSAVLDDETTGSEIRGKIPLGRVGHEDDIGGLAIFLASPASAWLTGAVIPLDGGMSLRG